MNQFHQRAVVPAIGSLWFPDVPVKRAIVERGDNWDCPVRKSVGEVSGKSREAQVPSAAVSPDAQVNW